MGKQSRDLGEEPLPNAIDEFIEELLGLLGTTLHWEPKGAWRWECNRRGCCGVPSCCRRKPIARRPKRLQQAKANEETPQNLLMSTQSIFGKEGTIDLEADPLESWCAVWDDAANGVCIAGKIPTQAQEIFAPNRQKAEPSVLTGMHNLQQDS